MIGGFIIAMFDSDYCSLLHPHQTPVMVLVVHADDVSDFVDDVPQVVHTVAPAFNPVASWT